METTQLNGIGIKASRIALGTWAIGGWMWGGSDEEESIRTIHVAFNHGINLIDKAPVYRCGRPRVHGAACQENRISLTRL